VSERIDKLISELAIAIREERQSEEMDDLLRQAANGSSETTRRIARQMGFTHENEEGK
jgi:hypothetical protein